MKQSDIEKDYWRYYVQIPYKSPVSKTYIDENGKEHTEMGHIDKRRCPPC